MLHGFITIWVNPQEKSGLSLVEGERELAKQDLATLGTVELHFFPESTEQAEYFGRGLAHAGGQAVATSVFSNVCLVRYFDRPSPEDTDPAAAIPLHIHNRYSLNYAQEAMGVYRSRQKSHIEDLKLRRQGEDLFLAISQKWRVLTEVVPEALHEYRSAVYFKRLEQLRAASNTVSFEIPVPGQVLSKATLNATLSEGSILFSLKDRHGLGFSEKFPIAESLPGPTREATEKYGFSDAHACECVPADKVAIGGYIDRVSGFVADCYDLKERHLKFATIRNLALERPPVISRLKKGQIFHSPRRGPVRLGTLSDGCSLPREWFSKWRAAGLVEEGDAHRDYRLTDAGWMAVNGRYEDAAQSVNARKADRDR